VQKPQAGAQIDAFGIRPDLEELLDGMMFNIYNDRPVRGTA
jgi:hypothetical protein